MAEMRKKKEGTMSPTILICDDDPAVHESLGAFLGKADMQVLSCYDGRSLLSQLKRQKVDLVVLDVMLPGKPGTELCREIRDSSDVPILMLSALGEGEDRIQGLLQGADDYVVKPFSPREVTIRIQTILRRITPVKRQPVRFYEDLSLDSEALAARACSRSLELTPKEFGVLECLIEEPEKVISRNQILNDVWGFDYVGDGRCVDTLVRRIRRKLEQAGSLCTIRSVYGVGYCLQKAGEGEEKE